jgi:hypothetical protein
MPLLLDTARKNIPLALFLGESILLRANYYTFCLISCPLTLVSLVVDKQHRTLDKGIEFCPIDKGQMVALYFVFMQKFLPLYVSHYMLTLNELKLFDVIETLKKQQRIVLEIFER